MRSNILYGLDGKRIDLSNENISCRLDDCHLIVKIIDPSESQNFFNSSLTLEGKGKVNFNITIDILSFGKDIDWSQ